MTDLLRQTGRTTRMLKEAVTLAEEGKTVYVYAANPSEKKRLQDLVGGRWEAGRRGIIFESIEHLEGERGLDPMRMSPKTMAGLRPCAVFLFDHFALESHFSNLLEVLHKYDPQILSPEDSPSESDREDNASAIAN